MVRKKKSDSVGGALGVAAVAVLAALAAVPKAAWFAVGGVVVVGVVVYLYLKRRSALARQTIAPLDPHQQQAEARASSTSSLSRKSTVFAPPVLDVSRSAGQIGSTFDARTPSNLPPLATGAGRWLPAAEGFSVQGHNASDKVNVATGLVYVGRLLPTHRGDADPCLIDPSKAVAANGDFTQRQTNYWPSYSEVSPVARRAYLNWLADGRKDPQADIGYVFMFFYGLERRVIVDASKDPEVLKDLPVIASELRRLLSIYGSKSGSFNRYAGELLDWVELAEHPAKIYLGQAPDFAQTHELPIYVRLALGQAAVDGVPVPAKFAFGWAKADPNIPFRTPAVRCPEQFARLFAQKYVSIHGEGIVLPRNRTKLKFVYRPASSGFRGLDEIRLSFGDIPDVSVLTAPVKKLRDVVEAATKGLEAYSRYVGKNPSGAASLEGLLQLPPTLWPPAAQLVVDGIAKRMGTGMVTMPFQDLLRDLDARAPPSRDKVLGLARALESMNIGLEPDVLGGAKLPKPDENIVLFATEPGEPVSRSDAVYQAALLTVQLSSAVAAADDDFSVAEMSQLLATIQSWAHLATNQKKRLLAQLRLLMIAPASLSGIKKKLEPLSHAARESIALFMAGIAQSDGVVHPAEIKLLQKAYRALGVESGKVLRNVREVGATGGGQSRTSRTEGPPASFQLDAVRLSQLRNETEKVSALLANIFEEAEPALAMPPVAVVDEGEAESVKASGILGLDDAHSALARMLLSRPHWSRAELLDVSSDLELMLDGALERINEASLDAHDMALTEGEDPLEVNEEVLEKLEA